MGVMRLLVFRLLLWSLAFLVAFPSRGQAQSYESPEGTWQGTAGDPRLRERWQVLYRGGQWQVNGEYFWNARGVAEDPERRLDAPAGRFTGVNVRVERGRLRFTQRFDVKPFAHWMDDILTEARADGSTLTFKNNWLTGVMLEKLE